MAIKLCFLIICNAILMLSNLNVNLKLKVKVYLAISHIKCLLKIINQSYDGKWGTIE